MSTTITTNANLDMNLGAGGEDWAPVLAELELLESGRTLGIRASLALIEALQL